MHSFRKSWNDSPYKIPDIVINLALGYILWIVEGLLMTNSSTGMIIFDKLSRSGSENFTTLSDFILVCVVFSVKVYAIKKLFITTARMSAPWQPENVCPSITKMEFIFSGDLCKWSPNQEFKNFIYEILFLWAS